MSHPYWQRGLVGVDPRAYLRQATQAALLAPGKATQISDPLVCSDATPTSGQAPIPHSPRMADHTLALTTGHGEWLHRKRPAERPRAEQLRAITAPPEVSKAHAQAQ